MFGGYEHPFLSLAKRLVNPLVIFLSLIVAVLVGQQKFDGLYLLLGILAFLLTSQIFDGFEFFEERNLCDTGSLIHGRNLLIAWAIVIAILGAVGSVSGILDDYNSQVLLLWSLLTPVLLFIGHSLVRSYLEMLRSNGDSVRRSVIVGANDLGHKLADRIYQQRTLMTRVEAFFDDRAGERCENDLKNVVFGGIDDVADYVSAHEIDLVYITLPILNHPRVLDLVNSLRDTTASIYFVPDVFMFDLVQARLDNVNGIPVISVFETPLTGINAVHKRAFDLVVSSLILCGIAPLMIFIAVLVRATSKGPVLFKQRRYGAAGEEILVYKFRSMCVCEDNLVTQATQNDARVTRIGAILRKTSLDELPQFLNVLQGTMSIVGPRPHAISHNEHYRKLIDGYMWRHKVKPGITGWAQINGYRGETDTIDKMEGRVIYDIAYLKSWSLWLDMTIILKTMKLVLKDTHAY